MQLVTILQNISNAIKNITGDFNRIARNDETFVRSWAKYPTYYRLRPRAPIKHIHELLPVASSTPIDLGAVLSHRANVSPSELYCIHLLAKVVAANSMFEIGTFDGATSLLLARASIHGKVYTLDLPQSTSNSQRDHFAKEITTLGVGSRFLSTAESSRITQLFGDSRTFNYKPWEGTMDLVFVDACHEYDYVFSDTLAAYQLVKPGGTIIWHDYRREWPGVVRALDELANVYRLDIINVAETSLAVHINVDLNAKSRIRSLAH